MSTIARGSAALGQNVNATVYGVFFGFYGSFAALSLGLTHDWFGIPAADQSQTTVLWLGSWLLVIGLLTVLSLRLPWTYPALFAVVDVALVLLIIGAVAGSPAATHAGGWAIFVFVGFVIYFYVAALWEETGFGIYGDNLSHGGINMWINRHAGSTTVTVSFPDNPEARHSVHRYVAALSLAFADVAKTTTDWIDQLTHHANTSDSCAVCSGRR